MQGLCMRDWPQFVNKLRSFKIDFSKRKHRWKIGWQILDSLKYWGGPTRPPSWQLGAKRLRKRAKKGQPWGSIRLRKDKGHPGVEEDFPSSSQWRAPTPLATPSLPQVLSPMFITATRGVAYLYLTGILWATGWSVRNKIDDPPDPADRLLHTFIYEIVC